MRAVVQLRNRIEDVVSEVSRARVADDADHLRPGGRIVLRRNRRPTAFAVPKNCRAIVSADHRHARRIRAVAPVEHAAVHERDAQRLEETRSRGHAFRRQPSICSSARALDPSTTIGTPVTRIGRPSDNAAASTPGMAAIRRPVVVDVPRRASPSSRRTARRSRASPRPPRRSRRGAPWSRSASAGRCSCRRAAAPRWRPERR